jgi:hypothetical protein
MSSLLQFLPSLELSLLACDGGSWILIQMKSKKKASMLRMRAQCAEAARQEKALPLEGATRAQWNCLLHTSVHYTTAFAVCTFARCCVSDLCRGSGTASERLRSQKRSISRQLLKSSCSPEGYLFHSWDAPAAAPADAMTSAVDETAVALTDS